MLRASPLRRGPVAGERLTAEAWLRRAEALRDQAFLDDGPLMEDPALRRERIRREEAALLAERALREEPSLAAGGSVLRDHSFADDRPRTAYFLGVAGGAALALTLGALLMLAVPGDATALAVLIVGVISWTTVVLLVLRLQRAPLTAARSHGDFRLLWRFVTWSSGSAGGVGEERAEVGGRVAGEPGDGVGDVGDVAVRDRDVGAHPGLDLPVRRAVDRAGRVRLVEGLVAELDRLARRGRHPGRRLGQRDRLRAGDVVRLAVVAALGEQRGAHPGHVVAGDERGPAAVGRPLDGARLGHHLRQEVEVEVHPRERPGHAAGPTRCSVAQWSRPRVNVEPSRGGDERR